MGLGVGVEKSGNKKEREKIHPTENDGNKEIIQSLLLSTR